MPNQRTTTERRLDQIEGAWLAHWRIKAGISQEAVAKRIGISLSTYQKYERGESHIRNDRVITIAKFLSVRFDQIRSTDIDKPRDFPPRKKGE